MKNNIISFLVIAAIFFLIPACKNDNHEDHNHENGHEEQEEGAHGEHEDEGEVVHLSAAQFEALDMQVGPLPVRNLSASVEANGELEVPPQNEATVTAITGANIASIEVIEGDNVKKGQVLAYLSHPELTRLQSDYLETYNRLQFLQKEYERQQKLYEAGVASGKTFQQTESEYQATQSQVSSLSAQLRQFGLDPGRISSGNFYAQVPVIAPISGTITKVEVKTGQYVQPEKDLFEIVNIDHIHADLMVFEKDVYKVREGQRVLFSVETLPDLELSAKIYSVGKKFEQNPKAVHVHAEIENKSPMLIPGMYIRGRILTNNMETTALPEEAIVREGEQFFAFLANKEAEGENEEWMFVPLEVVPGVTSNGFVGVDFLEKMPENAQFALNKAYYLMAEMKKGEAEHSH